MYAPMQESTHQGGDCSTEEEMCISHVYVLCGCPGRLQQLLEDCGQCWVYQVPDSDTDTLENCAKLKLQGSVLVDRHMAFKLIKSSNWALCQFENWKAYTSPLNFFLGVFSSWFLIKSSMLAWWSIWAHCMNLLHSSVRLLRESSNWTISKDVCQVAVGTSLLLEAVPMAMHGGDDEEVGGEEGGSSEELGEQQGQRRWIRAVLDLDPRILYPFDGGYSLTGFPPWCMVKTPGAQTSAHGTCTLQMVCTSPPYPPPIEAQAPSSRTAILAGQSWQEKTSAEGKANHTQQQPKLCLYCGFGTTVKLVPVWCGLRVIWFRPQANPYPYPPRPIPVPPQLYPYPCHTLTMSGEWKEGLGIHLLTVGSLYNIEGAKVFAKDLLHELCLPAARHLKIAHQLTLHDWIISVVETLISNNVLYMNPQDTEHIGPIVLLIIFKAKTAPENEQHLILQVATRLPGVDELDYGECDNHSQCIAMWKQWWWLQWWWLHVRKQLLHLGSPIAFSDIHELVAKELIPGMNLKCKVKAAQDAILIGRGQGLWLEQSKG
ncbi:hypothetical protein C8J57DRAFT_1211395 [Mycena rebaudengoi]|nr:hypothetical protein C8J57DRAFT_1211395 [Mycena rebaudengoi]